MGKAKTMEGPASPVIDPQMLRLDDLGLNTRAHRVLRQMSMETAADIIQMNSQQLMEMPGLGEGTVRHIRNRLAYFSLSLMPVPRVESEAKRARRERAEAYKQRWLSGETLDQIGRSDGVSRERIRQLISLVTPYDQWTSISRLARQQRQHIHRSPS